MFGISSVSHGASCEKVNVEFNTGSLHSQLQFRMFLFSLAARSIKLGTLKKYFNNIWDLFQKG